MNNTAGMARMSLPMGVVAALILGVGSIAAQAQNCTLNNWSEAVGLENGANDATGDVGSPPNFRRYAGPCGLRVPVNGEPGYVEDGTPAGETAYIARFYVFLNFSASAPITLFEALDASNASQLRLQYSGRDMTLDVFNNSTTQPIQFTGLTNGWNSVEIAWTQAPAAEVSFSLNGASETVPVDTAGRSIDKARMGNVNGATVASANIDFDDFDSRRQTHPGRLCRGLTDANRNELDLDDVFAIYGEFVSQGQSPAAGQPDYDENGTIDLDDVFLVYGRFVDQEGNCDLNR